MMKRGLLGLSLLFALSPSLASAAGLDMAKLDTAARRLPPGDYECKMGSYAFRACQVVADGQGVAVVIPDGIGHFLSARAEILPSDDANEVTFIGRLSGAGGICPRCPDAEMGKAECQETLAQKQECLAQPLVARLKKGKDQAFRGTLLYFILRPGYDRSGGGARYIGSFKLGNTIELVLRPKK